MDRLRIVLAEGEVYRSRGGSTQLLLLLAAVAAVVLAVVGFYLWNKSRKTRGGRSEEASPEDILAELCKAHELTRPEQALLVAVARNGQIAQPASLFIDPESLDRASEGDDLDAPRCGALRQKLFGSAL